MFAVTGATGHLGTKVISSLRQHVEASKIIAVARDAAKASALGVAVRIADYNDMEALTRAFDGVDTAHDFFEFARRPTERVNDNETPGLVI